MKIYCCDTCGDCQYCRIDEETNEAYCRQTYTEVDIDSSACESFMDDDY